MLARAALHSLGQRNENCVFEESVKYLIDFRLVATDFGSRDPFESRGVQTERRGKGRVRVNDQAMRNLETAAGGTVELQGQRRTGAVVMASYREDQGKGIIRVDGLSARDVF